MQQNADIIRNGAANFTSAETYFEMKQEDGESWYIIKFVVDGPTTVID